MKKWIAYVVLVVGVNLLAMYCGFNRAQVGSITIFAMFLFGTLFFWPFRLAFAFVGMTLLIIFGLIDIPHIIEFAGLDIILFLIAMMIFIGFLEERHFFEHIVNSMLNAVGNRPRLLMSLMLALACLFASLVDEVTSILFMTTTMLHITSRHRLRAAPFVMMVVFTTNIGSSATVVGNPIGVIIALRAGFTFVDFIRLATPIAACCLLLTISLCLWYFRKDIKGLRQEQEIEGRECAPEERHVTVNNLKIPWIIFLGTIGALIMHAQVEKFMHIPKNSMLLGTAFLAAGIVLFLERDRARELVERRVDWWTLAFFIMLFATVGTLKMVGTTTIIAKGLMKVTGGNPLPVFLGITWATGALTSIMDNVLAVATFVPVVGDLQALGLSTTPLWWGMLFGGTLLGNMTIVGSTANIVAIGMLERRGLGVITMGEWILPGAIVSLSTGILATFLLWWQLF